MARVGDWLHKMQRGAGRAASSDEVRVPSHIAIIMDGNGRWAKARNLPRLAGHKKGVDTVKSITRAASDLGVEYLTLYAFSTENWRRAPSEVSGLMGLVEEVLTRELSELSREGVRIRFMGRREGMPAGVQKAMLEAETTTRSNAGLTLILALNYGGRAELVDAARRLAELVRTGELELGDIDETRLAQALYLPDVPDPDLLVRTGGNFRISNFLLWQSAYTEIWVTDKYWPDFGPEDLVGALRDFQFRERRYGGTTTNPRQKG